jgi:hypothetical protein
VIASELNRLNTSTPTVTRRPLEPDVLRELEVDHRDAFAEELVGHEHVDGLRRRVPGHTEAAEALHCSGARARIVQPDTLPGSQIT